MTIDVASNHPQQGSPIWRAEQRNRVGPNVLVARGHHLVARRQVDPQLQTVEQSTAGNQPLRGPLDMQNPGTSGHPLRITVGNDPTAAVGIAVLESTIDHVGDGLEAAVRVPRGALWLARSVFD